jgi:hypothetical protein
MCVRSGKKGGSVNRARDRLATVGLKLATSGAFHPADLKPNGEAKVSKMRPPLPFRRHSHLTLTGIKHGKIDRQQDCHRSN